MSGAYFGTEGLSVGYNGKPLIRDITLNLKKGDILTLIGPNGSGKSTILKSLTKHLALLGGTVYIESNDLKTLSYKETAQKISVVLTERIHPERMTCREVAETGRFPYTGYFGRLTPADRKIVEDSLKKVRALDLAEQSFTAVSDGQKQRILLARALCQEPEIIVLDEPTSFLDIRHKMDLLGILRALAKERNITVVLSLHEIDFAAKISDVVLCVKGDTISRYGPPEEIFKEEIIAELYDIQNGSYNIVFGSIELKRPDGVPELFAVGGGGAGIPFYRRLQKDGIPFYAGVLHENDIDFQVAGALAAKTVSEKAFEPISDAALADALALVQTCRYVLDTRSPAGSLNKRNRELLLAAKRLGIPVIQSVGEYEK